MTSDGGRLRAAAAELGERVERYPRAEEAERMIGEQIPLDIRAAGKGRMGITRRFPIRPIAAISPCTFPLNLSAHHFAPAPDS